MNKFRWLQRIVPLVCVIGFINTYDSQSYDTNGSPRKHNLPTQQKEMATYVCVCVPSLLLLPLSNVLVSSDTTAGRGGAGASITGDGGVAAGAGGIIASAAPIIHAL